MGKIKPLKGEKGKNFASLFFSLECEINVGGMKFRTLSKSAAAFDIKMQLQSLKAAAAAREVAGKLEARRFP